MEIVKKVYKYRLYTVYEVYMYRVISEPRGVISEPRRVISEPWGVICEPGRVISEYFINL